MIEAGDAVIGIWNAVLTLLELAAMVGVVVVSLTGRRKA